MFGDESKWKSMLQRREQLGYSHHFELVRMTEGGWSCLAVHLFHLVPGSDDLPSTFFHQTKTRCDLSSQSVAVSGRTLQVCVGSHCNHPAKWYPCTCSPCTSCPLNHELLDPCSKSTAGAAWGMLSWLPEDVVNHFVLCAASVFYAFSIW